ncbi:MAG: LuxR C-terminal-related transcriptional regulator [Sphaerochaeta sp.]
MTYIYLGILIFVFGKNSAAQKSFAVLCAMLALWSVGCVGQNLSHSRALASFFDRIYYAGSELFILAGIIFILFLSVRHTVPLYRFLVLVVAIRNAVYQTASWGWNVIARDFPSGPWFVSHQLLSAAEALLIPLIALVWGKKTTLHREKIQSRIIVVSTLCGTIVGVLVDFFSGFKGNNPISCTIPVLWMVAVWYGIIRYGLMRFAPAHVNRELINHMDRAVFMIDSAWNITDCNAAARALIFQSENLRHSTPMHLVFLESQSIQMRVEASMAAGEHNFSHTGFLLASDGHPIPVVNSFSIISDSWGDRIGVLGFCLPKFDLNAFISRYHLSERQSEILHHIVNGRTQAQTAEALFISLATVKTHTTSLYNRLGISSRSELYAMLRTERGED